MPSSAFSLNKGPWHRFLIAPYNSKEETAWGAVPGSWLLTRVREEMLQSHAPLCVFISTKEAFCAAGPSSALGWQRHQATGLLRYHANSSCSHLLLISYRRFRSQATSPADILKYPQESLLKILWDGKRKSSLKLIGKVLVFSFFNLILEYLGRNTNISYTENPWISLVSRLMFELP